jgi:hypothetical protein
VSPIIPEPLATIKAPGTKLKTRPSAVPANVETMAATRRQVSGSFPPPVPEKSPKRLSFTAPVDNTNSSEAEVIDRAVAAHKKRRESLKPKLEFPGELGEDLSLDLDKEFSRVIESSKVDYPISYLSPIRESINSCTYDFRHPVQESAKHVPASQSSLYQSDSQSGPHANNSPKKGYLMRQNTKVIVAKRTFSNETADSDRPASADEVLGKPSQPSPRKPSHDRSKSWTTEPWNGKTRRKSLRSVDKKAPSGPAPPLPGQPSALDLVPEDQSLAFEEVEEGVERGRVFVKVVGVKDLDLPLPQSTYLFVRYLEILLTFSR